MKMPGGFRTPQIRAYLEKIWGLGPGRQDCILLLAGARPPTTRFSTQVEAEGFLDTIVKAYLAENNLSAAHSTTQDVAFTTIGAAGSTELAVTEPSDAQGMNTADLSRQAQQARMLGIDLHVKEKVHAETELRIQDLQTEMDALRAELGDAMIAGTKPKWSASKVRKFDSYWNWVLQDFIVNFGALFRGTYDVNDQELSHQIALIVNRSSPRLLKVALYLQRRIISGVLPAPEVASRYLSNIIEKSGIQDFNPTIYPFAQHVLDNCMAPRTLVAANGDIRYEEFPRSDSGQFPDLSIKVKSGHQWITHAKLTNDYRHLLEQFSASKLGSVSFTGKVALLIGASPSSIGSGILQGLLCGGARVIVATSSFSKRTANHFQRIYMSYGARGSQLQIVSFNQASQQDVNSLISWIYDPVKGLGLGLDHVIPFAAIPESGREIDGIDSKSELAHRMMLTNILRILGAVKREKSDRNFHNHITQVILPLSPNHGVFGGDGLYAESKLGLETLFTKWHAESWGSYLSICGASIGWTRGTGLMKWNDMVAEGIEKLGLRTFSQNEMALYVLMLMSGPIANINETVPIYADLTGGLGNFDGLKIALGKLRADINLQSTIRKAVLEDEKLDSDDTASSEVNGRSKSPKRKANLKLNFPTLPDYDVDLQPLAAGLHGMVDLDKIVVVTGIGEIGPYGNANTRWEVEAEGKFSLEGCIEMAWMMGMIRHHDGDIAGEYYNGWVDTKTLLPIEDSDIRTKYEKLILEHTGIRLVEPEMDIGYGIDPKKKYLLQEIVLTEDMPPVLVSKEMALNFQNEHGNLVGVYKSSEGNDEVSVTFKKGATILIPKAIKVEHAVAGQIPTGWDPKIYGISDEIISQVDRVTLFTLVSVSEAMLSSGITDAYEFYKYIHVSEIGNCIGSGLGGVGAMKKIFRGRYHDIPMQADILQELFVNTTAAWVNMLLISSAGPIRTPVGACATALESLESAYDLISSGKSKVCLVGGVDDLDQAISVEFDNMKATSDPKREREQGRLPHESSRPTTSTRNGFVESHGSGIQILTTARLAIDMGLPVHGIIAWAGISSDKFGRSIPAPGQGILTNAREEVSRFPSPLLSLSYRRRRLDMRLAQIKEWEDLELDVLKQESGTITIDKTAGEQTPSPQQRQNWIVQEAIQQQKEALGSFGHRFWHNNPYISPIRGALAVWGLTINDLDFASLHGTSTVKNDANETDVIQQQLTKLDRDEGNILFCICQKYLTGHSKGAAAAWMLNGCFQTLNSGLIPGQFNADNIDTGLRDREFLFFPNKSIQTQGLKAFSVTSFGFGQKGAQAIGIHPKYLFGVLDKEEYQLYCVKARKRAMKATQSFGGVMAGNSLFVAKESPPWKDGEEEAIFLDPAARI